MKKNIYSRLGVELMKSLLNYGDVIGIISCSDGMKLENRNIVEGIKYILNKLGFKTVFAKTIYRVNDTPFSGKPKERAEELMKLFLDSKIKAIVDISGGDSANQILPYLNYDIIKQNAKPFLGISDLSVLLNAIYSQTGITTYHFNVSTIINNTSQQNLFKYLFLDNNENKGFKTFNYSFLRGNKMSGVVIGGNIRCFLKLAGTMYMPDSTDKILFLESLGGNPNRIASLLSQIEQLGILNKCKGILLGTFTEMENKKFNPHIEELVMNITEKYKLPIVKTNQLGHGLDGHCLPIGKYIILENMIK